MGEEWLTSVQGTITDVQLTLKWPRLIVLFRTILHQLTSSSNFGRGRGQLGLGWSFPLLPVKHCRTQTAYFEGRVLIVQSSRREQRTR